MDQTIGLKCDVVVDDVSTAGSSRIVADEALRRAAEREALPVERHGAATQCVRSVAAGAIDEFHCRVVVDCDTGSHRGAAGGGHSRPAVIEYGGTGVGLVIRAQGNFADALFRKAAGSGDS